MMSCQWCSDTGFYEKSGYYCVCKAGSSLLSHDYLHRHTFHYTSSDQCQFDITFIGSHRMDIGDSAKFQLDSILITGGKIQWQGLSPYDHFPLPQDVIDYAERLLATRAFW
jgi:hypothetical protein